MSGTIASARFSSGHRFVVGHWESIEAEGWRLEHLSSAGSDNSQMLTMFRAVR